MVRGFCRRAISPRSDIEEAGDVLEVEILHPDGENSLVCYFLTLVGQRLKIMVAAGCTAGGALPGLEPVWPAKDSSRSIKRSICRSCLPVTLNRYTPSS